MRLAHCSDVHLLSLAGARLRDFANKRWIGGLNLLTNRGRHYRTEVFDAMADDFGRTGVDHVLCTGDLTNVALPEEFRFARERFDRIALGPRDVTVLPGNHDTYVAAGYPAFTEHFAELCTTDPGWENRDGELWPIVRVRGPVAIVGVCTSRPSPWFTAYGSIGDDQLARLRGILLDPRLDGLFRLVALHHPPAGKPAARRIRGLRDHAAFAAVIAETGADLVLHGHEHLDLRASLPGPGGAPIPVHGIQSGTYDAGNLAKRARYRVYRVEPGRGLVGAELRVWSPEQGGFAAELTTSEQSVNDGIPVTPSRMEP